MVRHLYVVLCVHHPESTLLPSPFIPPYPLLPPPPPPFPKVLFPCWLLAEGLTYLITLLPEPLHAASHNLVADFPYRMSKSLGRIEASLFVT